MNERLFKSIIDTTRDGFFVVGEKGQILDVNSAYCMMSGYTRAELLKMSIPEIEAQETSQDTAEHIRKIIETGTDHFESIHRRKNGSLFIVDVSTTYLPEFKQFVSFIRDITKRKQVERKLKTSEERSRTWLEYSPVCTKIVDADFNLQYMSAAGIKDLQIEDITTFYGKPYPFYFYPDSFKDEMKKNLDKARATGEIINQESPVVDVNGNELWYQSTIVPVLDDNSQIEYFIVVSLDVTKRNRAEKEKEKLQNYLSQAQKMEALGTLAGGIAHDFNNILAAIFGYAEMAKDDSSQGLIVVESIDKILESAERAKSLVRQILTFSRQSEEEKVPLQSAMIAKEVIKMLRPSLPSTIEIKYDINSTARPILADPVQLHQVLMNLCTNAFHAMEQTGGILSISLKEIFISDENLLHEQNIEAGNFIQLSVGDSGMGIPHNIMNKVFDPYFTTKEAGKGTGLGLAIVHGIVKNCNGFISFESNAGEGTVFHLFFPAIEYESTPEGKEGTLIPTGEEKILFIDDEEMIAEMAKSMLERLGYHVTTKHSSIEALRIFKKQPYQFDIVITDQTMPGMTGLDITKRMLEIRPDIPIILCTGHSTLISEKKAKSIGVKKIAWKPLSKREIATLIRKVLSDC